MEPEDVHDESRPLRSPAVHLTQELLVLERVPSFPCTLRMKKEPLSIGFGSSIRQEALGAHITDPESTLRMNTHVGSEAIAVEKALGPDARCA